MRDNTRKITTAAVCTALAVLFCAMTAYLPLSITPLYLAAFCIFLACKRGNIVYGLLCLMATVGIMFAMTGLSVKWLFLVFMFAPYGIITYFIHRFTYFKAKWAVVRVIISVLYFNLALGLTYIVVTNVVTIGLDVPILDWISHLGGYWVLAIIATVVLVPLDFIFSTLSTVILKRIPGGESVAVTKRVSGGADNGRKFDIFGYEIDETQNKEDDSRESAQNGNGASPGGDASETDKPEPPPHDGEDKEDK